MLTLIATLCLNALPLAAPAINPVNVIDARTEAVRAIDWQNIAFEGDIQLQGGQWSLEVEPGLFETVALEGVIHADLTGDGADEAVLLTTYYSGQAEPLSQLSLFTARDGEPRLLDTFDADALILDFTIDGHTIAVTVRDGLTTRHVTWRPAVAPHLGVAQAPRAR